MKVEFTNHLMDLKETTAPVVTWKDSSEVSLLLGLIYHLPLRAAFWEFRLLLGQKPFQSLNRALDFFFFPNLLGHLIGAVVIF